MLVSAIQQVIQIRYMCVYVCVCTLFQILSIVVYYKVLNIVPHTMSMTVLFIYVIYSQHMYLLIPNSLFIFSPSSLVTVSCFRVCVSLFLFCQLSSFESIFLDSTCDITIFVFVTYFT